MKHHGITFAGACLVAGLVAGCDSPSGETVAQHCQGVAQQECLIVALRDCRLLTSAKQDEFNACAPYKECSDGKYQSCVEEEKK